MASWIVDHSNALSFFFGAAALALLAAGWVTRRPRYWGYAAVAGLAVAWIFLLGLFVVSDRRQIEWNLQQMANGVIERRPDDVLRHVSKDFRFGAMNRDSLSKAIQRTVEVHHVHGVRLWGQQTTVDGDKGETIFNFRADAASGGIYMASAKAKFVREMGAWRLRELQIFKLGTTDRQHVPGID